MPIGRVKILLDTTLKDKSDFFGEISAIVFLDGKTKRQWDSLFLNFKRGVE